METVLPQPRGHEVKPFEAIQGVAAEWRVMNTDFEQLDIDGAVITEFKVVPSRKLVISLLRGPQKRNGRTVQTEFDLQFNGLAEFRIALESEPWLQVISHAEFSESEYLSKHAVSKIDTKTGKLSHFEITCGKGKLEIIARTVTLSEFNEIPYVESS